MPTRCPLQVHTPRQNGMERHFSWNLHSQTSLAGQRKRLTVHTILLVNVTAKLYDKYQGESRLHYYERTKLWYTVPGQPFTSFRSSSSTCVRPMTLSVDAEAPSFFDDGPRRWRGCKFGPVCSWLLGGALCVLVIITSITVVCSVCWPSL